MRESIYNLIPFEQPPKAAQPRYRSCSRREVISLFNTRKYPCKTMGVPKVPPPNPQKYLKMRHSAPELFRKRNVNDPSTKCSFYDCNLSTKKKPLPDLKSEVMNTVSSKNFIKNNIRMMEVSVPCKPKTFIVDTKMGHKFDIKYSGLEPLYVKRKSFGVLPKYLTEREKAASEAQKSYEEYTKQLKEKSALKMISESEKKVKLLLLITNFLFIQALLDQLKNKWQQRYRQYQSLSVMIDTPPKISHKLWLEKEMEDIEKDINLLEGFDYIYVAN
ncbi:Enkurin isoform 1 [Schistosoma japonicum]|uniref:Enkurin isoform 1 n=1 Tax=Schistosoma japonicum TaxID=6182 RepID=A0A4Z2DPH1_SCHJA|nr:Enkurin isoform 1 [Schistosoma japonicum]